MAPPEDSINRIQALACLLFFLCLCRLPAPAGASSLPEAPVRILVINSYHQSMQWEKDIFKALQDTLRPLENNIQLHVEHMDTKRIPYTDPYRNKLLAWLRYKYAGMGFRLIVASDNNAFDLMRQTRDTLFPGTPVVFCGVNFFRQDMLSGLSGFTGVAETFDARATLTAALTLHPETDQVLVINDYLPTGRAWTRAMKQDLRDVAPRVRISYVGDVSMPDLLDQLRALPDGSLVIYGVYFRDSLNRFYPPNESTSLIAGACPVPIYGLLDFNLGHGIIGGKLTSGYSQGKAAADIAARILKGEPPAEIPVATHGLNRFMFDHIQLEKWKINGRNLPDDALVINPPRSFYREHKTLVLELSVVFALMAWVILMLTLAFSRQKRAEKKFRHLHKTLEDKVGERTRELHQAMEIAEKTSRKLMVTSVEMQSILDNAPIGIIFATTDRRIKQVNAEVVRISGYALKDLIGKTAREMFMSSQAYREFGEKAYPTLLDHQIYEARIQLKKKNGHPVWCNIMGRLVSHCDHTQGVIWIISDISEHMAAEQERKAIARELEQAQRYKSLNVMAGAIAHHYNNIMTSVQGNIELLLMGLPESSRIRKLAVNALNSAQKASGMSTSMLVYVGQQQVHPMALDLSALVQDLRELLSNNVRPGTEIRVEQATAPMFCNVDPAQIREVILNLVVNADESIPEDSGRISLRTYAATLRDIGRPAPFRDVDLSADQYVCCEIEDNGTGMDKETSDHMFEPFFSTKFTGRGLGLSIVAGILKAHNGAVRVISTPGKGTAIRFFLPAAPAPVKTQPELEDNLAAAPDLPTFTGKVILADDNLDAARIGELLMKRLGFEVFLASDGREAIDLYRVHGHTRPLVLLDAVMPRVSGTDALKRIRKIDPEARIILISGYSQDQIEPDLTTARPDAFVQKPYSRDKLVDAFTRIMPCPGSTP